MTHCIIDWWKNWERVSTWKHLCTNCTSSTSQNVLIDSNFGIITCYWYQCLPCHLTVTTYLYLLCHIVCMLLVTLTTYPSVSDGTGVQITVIEMAVLLTRVGGGEQILSWGNYILYHVIIVVKLLTISNRSVTNDTMY